MPSYRVEYAKTNRGGCQAPECKKNKVKVEKGGVKFGVWVQTNNENTHDFWSWRHWGCVTPKQIANLKTALDEDFDGDYTELDGYEDMEEEDQERISDAIEEGHVADEDLFTGIDPEMNRPGAAEALKKREKAEKQALKEAERAEKKAAASAAKQSKRKRVNEEDSEEELEEDAKPKKRGRRVKNEEGVDVSNSRPKRSKKQVNYKSEPEGISDEVDFEPVKSEKKARSSKNTSNVKLEIGEVTSQFVKNETDSSSNEPEPTRGIKSEPEEDVKPAEDDLDEENEVTDDSKVDQKPISKGRRSKASSLNAYKAPLRKSTRHKSA